MTEVKKPSLHPISEDLCNKFKELAEREDIRFSLHGEQIDNLDSIVKTVYASYFGYIRYPSNKEKASAFFYYIIKRHPVVEGNKRLAVAWLEYYCIATELVITLPPDYTLDGLAVAVESSRYAHDKIIKALTRILFSGKQTKSYKI